MDTQSTGLWGSIQAWLATPFKTQGSALNWVLFVGLLIVAVWFWQVVLIDLQRDI